MKKLSARIWIWVKHSVQSITNCCSKNLKLMVPAYGFQLRAVFVQNRKEFVRLDARISEVRNKNARVPQRSALGLLLFLIYIKNRTDIQHENLQMALFAGGCSILTSHQNNFFLAHEKQLHQIKRGWVPTNLPQFLTFYLKFGRRKWMRRTFRKDEKISESTKQY